MQYMNVKDLLVMSEVSVDWNGRAEKKLLDKKLKLSLKDEMKDEDFAALMESERNYESVELVYSEENYDAIGKWIDVIRKLAPAIVDLKIEEINHVTLRKQAPALIAATQFPNLKKLKLKNICSLSIHEWLYNSTFQPEKMKIESKYNPYPRIDVTKLLMNQKQLIDFDCTRAAWIYVGDDIYDRSAFVPQFSLKVFRFIREDNDNGVWEILKASRESLEEISVEAMESQFSCIDFIKNYPNLTKLSIGSARLDWGTNPELFQTNFKITHLQFFEHEAEDDTELLHSVLLNLPNLKQLQLVVLRDELMEIAATNLRKLEKLIYAKIPENGQSPLDRYEELKAEDLIIINHSIQLEQRPLNPELSQQFTYQHRD